MSLQWAPWEGLSPVVFSTADDNTVITWDLARVGADQDPEDAADGPPAVRSVPGDARADGGGAMRRRHRKATDSRHSG